MIELSSYSQVNDFIIGIILSAVMSVVGPHGLSHTLPGRARELCLLPPCQYCSSNAQTKLCYPLFLISYVGECEISLHLSDPSFQFHCVPHESLGWGCFLKRLSLLPFWPGPESGDAYVMYLDGGGGGI